MLRHGTAALTRAPCSFSSASHGATPRNKRHSLNSQQLPKRVDTGASQLSCASPPRFAQPNVESITKGRRSFAATPISTVSGEEEAPQHRAHSPFHNHSLATVFRLLAATADAAAALRSETTPSNDWEGFHQIRNAMSGERQRCCVQYSSLRRPLSPADLVQNDVFLCRKWTHTGSARA